MKHIHITLLFLVLMNMMSIEAKAYDCLINGIYYNLNTSKREAEVTSDDPYSYEGNVSIPQTITYNGTKYSITSIGPSAFSGNIGLTSVTIPNGVTFIGNWAFYNCSGLTSVIIPNSVTSIGEYAFAGCSGLTSVVIPNSITSISSYTFRECAGLTSIIIPNNVTSIDQGAFSNCRGLQSLTISNNVKYISDYAFVDCSSLASVVIPNSVTFIGSYTFAGCAGLTSVTIPNTITSIGNHAFSGCNSLTSVAIPNSVTSIGADAFRDCNNLNSVVSEIKEPFAFGTYAFNDISPSCTLSVPDGTKSAYIAKGWTQNVFKGGNIDAAAPRIFFVDAAVEALCVAEWDTNKDGELSEAEAAAITSLGTVFKNNKQISSFDELRYFTGLTTISTDAFFGCSNLKSITIPNTVTYIGADAFCYCI